MRNVYLLAFVLWANVATAQNTTFYGFGSVNMPIEDGEEYNFRWARAGITTTDKWFLVHYEYDLSCSETKYAYARVCKPIVGGEISLFFGKFLNPVIYLYPSPKTLRPVRWAETKDNFSIYALGLSLWYERKDLVFRAAHYGDNNMSASIKFHELSLFWEDGIGYGFTLESTWTKWWVHPWIGLSIYEDNREVVSIQNYIQLPYNVRLYVLIDLGDRLPNRHGERPTDGKPLIGATWEFFKNSFLKIYYEGKDEKFLVESTFSFTLY